MPARRFTDEEEALILSEYRSGIEVPILAESRGAPLTAIRSVLGRHKIPRRGPSEVSRRPNYEALGRIEIDTDHAYALYERGYSTPRIASMLGVNEGVVQQRLKDAGHTLGKNSNYLYDKKFFSHYTAASCYWAGFIAADGNISKSSNVVNLKLQESDETTVQNFKISTKAEHSVRRISTEEGRKDQRILAVGAPEWKIALLENFNLTPDKTYTLQPPPEKLPAELLGHYMRGFLDGDGHVDARGRHGYFTWVCASEVYTKWFSSVLTASTYSKIARQGADLYQGHASILRNFEFIYGGSYPLIRLGRKYDKACQVLKELEESDWSGDRTKLSQADELEIVRRYNSGEKQEDIAEDYPIKRATVGNILDRHTVDKRKKGPVPKIRGSILTKARMLREQGWSYRKIGRELGYSHSMVTNALNYDWGDTE